MAYEKQTWVTGEVITEEKLNHMEDGIAGAGGGVDDLMIVNVSVDDNTADKTCAEVLEHLMADGKPVILVKGTGVYFYSGFTFSQTGSPNGAKFCCLRSNDAQMMVFIAILNSDNTVTEDSKQIAYTS